MTRYAKTMSEALQEVSRAESNKVNAQLSKILGKIRFTDIYNQKGGIFDTRKGQIFSNII